MSNERYLILKALEKAASEKIGSSLLTIVSPSNHGKSATIEMILREHERSYLMTSMSETALYDALIAHQTDTMFIVDDRTSWPRQQDFKTAVSYLRFLGMGQLKSLRKTKFTPEDSPISVSCVAVLTVNPPQYNEIAGMLRVNGWEERSLKLKVSHSDEEYQRILNAYDEHGWNNEHPPSLRIPDGFFKDNPREPIDHEVKSWIDQTFRTGAKKTIMNLARIVSTEGFISLKPILRSGHTEKDFMEKIEFKYE